MLWRGHECRFGFGLTLQVDKSTCISFMRDATKTAPKNKFSTTGCPHSRSWTASIISENMMNASIRTPNKRSSGRYGGPTTTPQQLFGSLMDSIAEGEGDGWEQAWSNGARGRTPRAVNNKASARSKSKSIAAGSASTTTNGTASYASHRTSCTPSKKENLTNNNITRTYSKDHSSVTQKKEMKKSPKPKESSLVISPTAQLKKKATKVARNLFKKEKGKNAFTQTELSKSDASTQTLAETVYVQHISGVTRSLHDRTRGDLDRSNLGAGNLVILKSCLENENGYVFVCQFVGDDGNLKFQSDIPDKSDAHRHMKLVPGEENALLWDAHNTALKHVTLRSYSFYFDDGPELFATLLHMFGSVEIVKEFLSGSRFKLDKPTLPPHPIRKGDDDMDVNSEDEEHRLPALSEEEAADKYGHVQEESQFLY